MVIEHRIEYFCRTIPPEPSQQMTWWPISPLSVTFSSSDLPISRSKAFNFFWSQLHVFGVSTQPCATSSCCESTNSNPNWTKFKSFNLWIENAGYIGQAFYICPSSFLSIQVSIPHEFNFLTGICLLKFLCTSHCLPIPHFNHTVPLCWTDVLVRCQKFSACFVFWKILACVMWLIVTNIL